MTTVGIYAVQRTDVSVELIRPIVKAFPELEPNEVAWRSVAHSAQ
jgi:hypothetical protein